MAPALASACVRACVRARAQCRHGRRWRRQHREQLVSAPIAAKRVGFSFRRVDCHHGHCGHACAVVAPSRCRRHTYMFDGGAGVCVFLCACMPPCAGAVTPRSAVADRTRRAASESPHRGEACWLFFCAGVNVVVGIEGLREPPSLGQSLSVATTRALRRRRHLPVDVHASVRGRSYAAVGGGYGNTASHK